MANVEGTFSVSNFETNRAILDVRDKIFMLNPAATPFLQFTKDLEGDDAHSMRIDWWEDDFLTFTDTALSAATSTATTIYVNNPDRYMVGHVVWNQTSGERILVTSVVTASDYILGTRSFGETAAATVLADDPLVILGTAALEGDTSQSGLTTTKSNPYNYLQEFRTPYEMTERAMNVKLYTGYSFPQESKKAADEHKMEIERALLFGERDVAYTSANARYATRGLKTWASSANAFDVDGLLPEADFDDWVRKVFRDGSGDSVSQTKVMLANDRLIAVINKYMKMRLQTKMSDTKYGFKVTDYVTPHGNIKLVYHKLLDKVYSNEGYGLLFDPANVNVRYFSGPKTSGRTKLHTNIQANDATKQKDEYRTTIGLEVQHATTHGEISGVQG